MKKFLFFFATFVLILSCEVVTNPKTPAVEQPVVKNDGPIIKAFVIYDSSMAILSFDRQIAAGQGSNLTKDLVFSQTIGTTTTTWGSSELTCVINNNTSNVSIVLNTGAFSLIDTVKIRTQTDANIKTLGVDGKKMSSIDGTYGLVNSSFAAISLNEGFAANSTAVGGFVSIAGSESNFASVKFNKNIDRTTLDSGTWTSIDATNYVVEKTAWFDGDLNKISIAGLGTFKFTDLSVGTGNGLASATVFLKVDVSNNTAFLSFKTAPSSSVSFSSGSVIRFTPAETIRTTVATWVSTDFIPEVTTD